MSRRWLLPCALFLVALAGVTPLPSAPAPVVRRPRVEVVIVMDTTGSMSMIEPAKNKIYALINLILSGKPMPDLRVGLVAFKDRGDEYVTKPFDLREDFDEIQAEYKTYSANGGNDTPESVNQALDDTVNKLSWSKDKKTIKLVFLVGDAAAHMDYPDDVKFQVTCRKAKEMGIIINTIQAGGDADCTKHFKEIAELTGGEYLSINSSGGMRTISTDQDARLNEIYRDLTRSVLYYGDTTRRERTTKKFSTITSLTGDVAADRVGIMAKMRQLVQGDLLDALRAGDVQLASLKPEELPDAMKIMSPKQREEYLDKTSQDRARLFQAAVELDRQRATTLMREMEKTKDSFDFAILDTVRKQMAKRVRY